MPFFDHDPRRNWDPVYYRHWPSSDPRAAVVFLHGFGEHTGLYHRYGFTLNCAGIDLWAVDQFGHGLSAGQRGRVGTIEETEALIETLTALAERHAPGIPCVAQGHSWGAIPILALALKAPQRYAAAVVSGAPLVPIAEMLDANTTLNLDVRGFSADPFYLDSIQNDPLGFTAADTRVLTRELDRAWDRFGAELPRLSVPTLAVHGEIDPIADPGAVRAYAEQIPAMQYREFAGTRHDVLNDTTHREVAEQIIGFITERTGTRA